VRQGFDEIKCPRAQDVSTNAGIDVDLRFGLFVLSAFDKSNTCAPVKSLREFPLPKQPAPDPLMRQVITQ